jgi:thiamine kinase-like enzyme
MTRGSALGRSRSQRRASPSKATSNSSIEGIVDQIAGFKGRVDSIDPLEGGITNRNYRVVVAGETFVVRVGGERTDLLGIDRAIEAEATRLAATSGVGPEVVAFLAVPGVLVTRFINGTAMAPDSMRQADSLHRIAAALRRVHAGGYVEKTFSPFRVVRDYWVTAGRHGVPIPEAFEGALAVADLVEAALPPFRPSFCHNDLLNANFIDDGVAVRIVDWEYAGMGDPFFDLGNFAVNHELDPAGEQILLTAYLGECRPADLARLRLMRAMSDFREAMWGVVQQGISALDFDFRGYAHKHFDRLQVAASQPAFRDWLGQVRE